jgi:hypothetical protein
MADSSLKGDKACLPFIARDVPFWLERLKIPDKISKNGKILTKLSVIN